MSHKSVTHKLGPIKSQPPGSPFKLPRRYPGWYPDADDNGSGRIDLYLEEAIYQDPVNEKFKPFPVPATGSAKSFEEPDAAASPKEWLDFNQWILGGSIPAAPVNIEDEPAMTTLIRELANHVRCYNASLYRLRRLHYYAHTKNNPAADPMPPRNPNGDPLDPLPTVGTKPFNALVTDAENDWKAVTAKIGAFVDEAMPHFYKKNILGKLRDVTVNMVAADMVEVNGYITSMRVVANVLIVGGEVGGSSSHVSVSSAFSSM